MTKACPTTPIGGITGDQAIPQVSVALSHHLEVAPGAILCLLACLCELPASERCESNSFRKTRETKLPCFLPDPTELVLSCSSTELPAKSKGRRSREGTDAAASNGHSLHLSPRVPAGGLLGGCWSSALG